MEGASTGGIHRFRVILSNGTRSLKHTVLEPVTDEPTRAGLRKRPKGHRRSWPHQSMEN